MLQDLPSKLETGLEKAISHFRLLFADYGLNFDQAGPWYKLEDGKLLPPSNDEEKEAKKEGDGAEDKVVDV